MRFFHRNTSKYGRTTMLTLNVLYTLSIITFLYASYCYFGLDIKGPLSISLIVYALVNTINILLFYTHKKIVTTYNIASGLGFVLTVVLSYYSGGINSPVISFLVLLIYFGYLIGKRYGNFWLVLVFLTISIFYTLERLGIKIVSEINPTNTTEFKLIFLLFLIVLLGGVFGRMMNITNIRIKSAKSELLKRDDEKAVMLREIHHRVKNNLHVINSLLRLQSRSLKDPIIKEMFTMAQRRIVTMARLHEKIYETDNLKYIDVQEYLNEFVLDLIQGYSIGDKVIKHQISIAPIQLTIDVLLPLSLLINEIVTNSLKHAFINKSEGLIRVTLEESSKKVYTLQLSDDGSGFVNGNKEPGLGKKLIDSFVRQLNGDLVFNSSAKGTEFRITFTA